MEEDGRESACGRSGERVQRRGTPQGEWDRGDPAGQVTTAVFLAKVRLGTLTFYGSDELNIDCGRRTKDIIKDKLPKKYDAVVFCPLTEMQVKVYKQILGMEAVQNMTKKDEPCNCGRGKRYGKMRVNLVHLLTEISGGRSAVTLSSREIFSSTCLR